MSQITTITFFRYERIVQKIWAFGMMQFAHKGLQSVKGLEFYKLLGTGKGNGFNPWPDFSTYALLQVWKTEADAEAFLATSSLMEKYRKNSSQQWTLFMHAIKAEGKWSGSNPFTISQPATEDHSLIAVITRATIRKRQLWRFWKYVPTSQKPLEGIDGLIYTKGIGEVPFLQMATFSIWSDAEAMKQFAYKTREHTKAIQLTKELDWYGEELFSRFAPYRSVGYWDHAKPLAELERLQ